MSLVVLPYPNLDFVPLDVLKADDLDKIVANINAINGYTPPASPIVAQGTTSLTVASEATTTANITIATQSDINYRIFLQSADPNIVAVPSSKTTTGFTIAGTNNSDEAITATIDYLVVRS